MITEVKTAPASGSPASPAEDASCCEPEPKFRWTSPYLWGSISLSVLLALILWAGAGREVSADLIAAEIKRNLLFMLNSFWGIAPFFLLSVGVSAWVTVAGYADKIKAVFEKRQGMAITGAAAVGAVVPFCSCGVIPLIAAMFASGVPLGPVMAFWISSPLMSPEKFVLTAGVLGTDYAIARLISAVVLGAATGYATYLIGRGGRLDGELRSIVAPGARENQGDTRMHRPSWSDFTVQASSVGLYLAKWLAVAFFLEALIVHYVDPAWIGAILGSENPWSIPLASAVGIPLYTSGVAAIPITKGLLAAGMGAGAAMAFLIAGPVTCVPAMAGVWVLVKRKILAIYLAGGILGSLFAGYAFQLFVRL
ncbi:MAG: permease [Nitrospinae bacterium]|nr:permease [Nitrospinota bacterium]